MKQTAFNPLLLSLFSCFALALQAPARAQDSDFERLQKAAAAGDAQSEFKLGQDYDTGTGVKDDHAKAVEWYLKAAEQGNPHAQTNLGGLYSQGQGVRRDDAEAVKWFRMAAAQDDPLGEKNLAVMFAGGFGVPQDTKQAVDWFKKAAAHGNSDAAASVGVLYCTGASGFPRNFNEAFPWLIKGSSVPAAQYYLALSYERGLRKIGVQKDLKQAVDWLHKAAENGDVLAQFKLGELYATGRPGEVEKNIPQMFLWLTLSAEQGYLLAQHDLPSLTQAAFPSDIAAGEELLAQYRSRHPSRQN